MGIYWLLDRAIGEETLVDGDTVARLLKVEMGYVDWCIETDGSFENGAWKVSTSPRCNRNRGICGD